MGHVCGSQAQRERAQRPTAPERGHQGKPPRGNWPQQAGGPGTASALPPGAEEAEDIGQGEDHVCARLSL